MTVVLEVLGWVLVVLGVGFLVLVGVGLHRFGDSYARLHVAGKAATLGVVATLVGTAALLEDGPGSARLLLTALFLLITSPAGAQALAGSAYRARNPLAKTTTFAPLED